MSRQAHFERMRAQPRWFFLALLPIAVGVLWLVIGWNAGIALGLLASVPGVVLTGSGASLLLWPGDRHITHYMSLAGAVSVLLALILGAGLGGAGALLLTAGGITSFLVAGRAALYQNPVPLDIPEPDASLKLSRKVAVDEALLAYFLSCATIPRGSKVARDAAELERLSDLVEQHRWADDPAPLHGTPGVPEHVKTRHMRAARQDFEWITFDSGYAPPEALPGIARWQAHRPNRRAGARVLRHAGGPRPWLMCVHGYRMGLPFIDFSLFNIRHLHHELGMNIIMPILPLHGPRKIARLSGGAFLDGPMADLFHAQSQTLWDLRRCLTWLRAAEDEPDIGVLGYSLGGYHAALLAAFEPALACVIAGIPLVDIPTVLWRHMPTLHLRNIETHGITRDWPSRIMAPVSPLYQPPVVPAGRRYLFAATGDQLVPPEQPLRLWYHWDQPSSHWYQGAHLSVRRELGASSFVDDALTESGLVPRVPQPGR